MSSEATSTLTVESPGVPSPETQEDIIDLIIAFTPDNRPVYAGEISLSINEGIGAYISPDMIGRLIFREIRTIKRTWTPQGWKYIRMRTLEDY